MLEVKILGVTTDSVEYRAPSGKKIVATAPDFAAWLLSMQESGMEIVLQEKVGGNSLYAHSKTISDVLVSSGTARFLQEADRLHIGYTLNSMRQGVNAAAMAYAKPKQQQEGGVRDVLYFLVFSQPSKEQIPADTLQRVTGVTKPDRAKNNALRLLKNEMTLPALAPFVSQDFRTLTQIIFDKPSLARPELHDFSTGIPPQKGGGYIHMPMSDAYRAVRGLHKDNVSTAKLL